MDAIICDERNQYVFEAAQIPMQVLPAHAQIENRVADQLARAVISRLAAAVGLHHGMRERAGVAQAGLIGRAADGVDRLVLEQEQFIGHGRLDRFARDDLFLERKRIGKSHAAEPANRKHAATNTPNAAHVMREIALFRRLVQLLALRLLRR